MSRKLSREEVFLIDKEKRVRFPIGGGMIIVGLISLPFLLMFFPFGWILPTIWLAVTLVGTGIVVTTPNYAKCDRCHVIYDNLWHHSDDDCLRNLKQALEELK